MQPRTVETGWSSAAAIARQLCPSAHPDYFIAPEYAPRAPDRLSPGFGGAHAGQSAFADNLPLKFRCARENGQHEPAGGVRGVEVGAPKTANFSCATSAKRTDPDDQ
jgi:hypothetical protein